MKKFILTYKKWLIVSGAVLILLGGILLVLNKNNTPEEDLNLGKTKKKISQPVNVIPVAERPYIELIPSADGHYITLSIKETKKAANSVDYEMEYQTGSMLQGFQGNIILKNGQAEEKKLFGSQSAGGAITYHQDIQGGSLLAQFEGGAEAYAVKSAWRYFENLDKETAFRSQDGKFEIENSGLAKVKHLIVYNVPGYPGELQGELLSDPYALSADQSLKSSSSLYRVSIQSHQDDALIWGFDGEDWQKLETSIEDGIASAEAPYMEIYLLVK